MFNRISIARESPLELMPHLSFNGQCKAAFQFYAEQLGGNVHMMMTYAESPMAEQAPPGLRDKVLHARMSIGTIQLMGADIPPSQYHPPSGISLAINLKDANEAERVFNALADGGTVQFPLQSTFWAERFAMLVDKFGISWMINCEMPA